MFLEIYLSISHLNHLNLTELALEPWGASTPFTREVRPAPPELFFSTAVADLRSRLSFRQT